MIGKERHFVSILSRLPHAVAIVKGSEDYENVIGIVKFYQTDRGVLVAAEVTGLPYLPGSCEHFVFGFHIHEGTDCSGNEGDVFAGSMMHYNPNKCPHPRHAGDLPPLLGNRGYAFTIFLTNRFVVDEVIGRTVIIHASPDDFKTQPSGNSGEKIACGVIR
ncbi:MAG: superoxide dismutase family protein [Tyzzerella sp.]|nr:superoxide dismutase family protein [Tyzzerella sp.]